jgi:hypothetical protein
LIAFLRRTTITNLTSPYTLVLVSSSLFLLAWLFPPSVYSAYIFEPDLLFLDPISLCFFGLCMAGLLFGIRTFISFRRISYSAPLQITASSPFLAVSFPLIITSIGCTAYMITIATRMKGLLGLLLSGDGNASRGTFYDLSWQAVLLVHTTVLWWSQRRAQQLGVRALSYRVILYYGFFGGAVICIARLDRTSLMPIVCGAALIWIDGRISKHRSLLRVLRQIFLALASLIGLFSIISFFRGASRSSLLITSLLGYSVVSYKRMAAELHGLLHYTFAGSGVYLSYFLSFASSLPFHNLLGGVPSDIMFQMEFQDVGAAGLMGAFNWASVPGYIYGDLGWFTPLWFFGIGLICGWAWLGFKQGRAMGTSLYPWFAFCLLFMFGWNVMFELRFVEILLTAIALAAYEKLFMYVRVKSEIPQLKRTTNGLTAATETTKAPA